MFFASNILGLLKKFDFQKEKSDMKLFKSEIFDHRNGWGRNKLGQETNSVSFIYFA